MKKKETKDSVKVNGLYINDFIRGFLGEHKEGVDMLKGMGLPSDTVPFSAAIFFQKRTAFWQDMYGNVATISFKFEQSQIVCNGTLKEKRDLKKGEKKKIRKKSHRLVREWGAYEDPEMIARLESEAIGDLCMKCIFELISKE